MRWHFKNSWIEKNNPAIFYGLCACIIYSMLFWTYLSSVFSIILALYWLVFLEKQFDITTRRTRLMLLFTTLYVLALAGMFYTENKLTGYFTLQKQSALLIFPLIFGTTTLLSEKFIHKIAKHIVIAVSLTCILGLSAGLKEFLQDGHPDALTGSNLIVFNHLRPVTMGLFCLLALLVLTGISFRPAKLSNRWRPVLFVLISLFIFLLSLRLIIFLWILFVIYYLWHTIKSFQKRVILGSALAMVVLLSFFFIPALKKQWNELADFSEQTLIPLDSDASLGRSWGGKAIRVAIWKSASDLLKAHWLTGVGTGDVQDSLQQAYENRMFYFASRHNRYNAHNQYLQTLFAHGIAGLVALMACIVVPLAGYGKHYQNNTYFIFLLIFASACVTESLLEVNKGIVWYSFFNSIFAFGLLKKRIIE